MTIRFDHGRTDDSGPSQRLLASFSVVEVRALARQLLQHADALESRLDAHDDHATATCGATQ